MHGEPFSNYVTKIPNVPKPTHLDMLNANKYIADGDCKDTGYSRSVPSSS